MPSITYHIYKNIAVKFLAVKGGYLRCFHNCFCVISVNMQHGCLHKTCYRCTIVCASGIVKICSKSYLVIDHKMDCSAGIISFKPAHLQQLVYNTLASYRGIAMY